MMCENDRYEIPRKVLEMPVKQLKAELKKAHSEMVANPKKKPKPKLRANIKFNF